MKTLYIYLSNEDKTKLKKIAQSKMLSISAVVDIICSKYYLFFTTTLHDNTKYEYKGNLKTKLNIRTKATWPVNDKLATNCIYAYFHKECLQFFPNQNAIKNLDRKIQSDFDKTIDNNFLKAQIIRQTYKTLKEQQA